MSESPEGRGARAGRAAGRLLAKARQTARDEEARKAAKERLRSSADQATQYARDHEDEIRRAAELGLNAAAGRTRSAPVRLAANAAVKALRQKPKEDERPAE